MADDERRRSSSSSSGRRRRRRRRMDLNLYIGLPLSPRRLPLDLGSDLALSSLPLSTSSADVSSDFHAPPYSPSPPNPTTLLPSNPDYIHPDREQEDVEDEDTYFPSPPMIPIPGFAPISSPDSDGPMEIDDDNNNNPNSSTPPPGANGPTYDPLSPYYFPPHSWSYIPLDNEDLSPPYALSPPYSPSSPSYTRPMTPRPDWPARNDESSSRWDHLDSPELRFTRLIESNRRMRVRRFRSPQLRSGRPPSPEPEQLRLNIISSQRSLASNGKHKDQAGRIASESSDQGKEEKNKSAANFECNICFDMAEDPVVTSCGHLFCWPCLFQWLHVHSEHKECPVCKGEVTECNITPIYGRGSSGASEGKKLAENRESGMKIPPRPDGNRLDSLRQQLQPAPGRYTEGTVTSWRHPYYMQIRSRYRHQALGDPSSLQGLTSQQIALLNGVRSGHPREGVNPESEPEPEPEDFRMPRENSTVPQLSNAGSLRGRRRARLAGEELHAESRPEVEEIRMSRGSTAAPISNSSVPHFREGVSARRRVSVYDLTSTDGVHADTGRIIGSSNRYGASTSLDTWLTERRNSWANIPSAADQASASSTAAMIRGDGGQPDDSVERNSRRFV